MKTIKTYTNLFEAQSEKAVLESEGIEVFLKNENTLAVQPFYNVMLGGIELQVDENDIPRTVELIGGEEGTREEVQKICRESRSMFLYALGIGLFLGSVYAVGTWGGAETLIGAFGVVLFSTLLAMIALSYLFKEQKPSPAEEPLPMIIRDETPQDYDAITKVTIAAFKTLPISNNTEQYIIHALRKAEALTLSLVAEIDGDVVGHIAFSPVVIADGTPDWYGLGPVAVLPELHKQGIGKALVEEGLSRLEALDAKGCALVGDPNYYTRFGFRNIPDMIHEGIPQEYFLVLPFTDEVPSGIVSFHEAFHATDWQ
jgi:putative acetyltransferase